MPLDADTERYADPRDEKLASTRAQRVATLYWTDSTGPHEFTLARPVTVGFAPSCGLVIADPTVSRVHLELNPTDAGVTIRDLGSSNGTFVDAMQIRDVTVRGDARIRLGRVELDIHQRDQSITVPVWPRPQFGRLIGRSEVMRGLFDQLARIAPTDETVLVHGESGTGKELIAEAIHTHSRRRSGPYVIVDCGTLSPQLVESELFGHARGAFSGAVQTHQGHFEAANGGTIFLDEIGELPLEMQPKLLRALEARAVRRVGETEYRPIDVRVVSASHRDLREMVNRGAFREDLYFRLAVIPMRVPALREHLEDLPLLVDSFLREKKIDGLRPGPDLMAKLLARPWNGNVRDVRSVVSRAVALGWEAALEASDHAPMSEPVATPVTAVVVAEPPAAPGPELPSLKGTFYEVRQRYSEFFERAYLARLVKKYKDDMFAAAVDAGLDHSYLRKLRKKWGV